MNYEKIEKTSHTPLKGIEPIEESRNKIITNKNQLTEVVEAPLLDASIKLYDKNIRTLSTSANKKDIEGGFVYIIIDFDSLSTKNQEIAKQFAQPIDYDGGQAVKIEIPVDKNISLEEINKISNKIVDKFQKQPMIWVPTFTLVQLKRAFGIKEEETQFDNPKIWEEDGYFYDKKNKIFYMSEEHYKKASEKLD